MNDTTQAHGSAPPFIKTNSIPIHQRDIDRLLNPSWMSDPIINAFLSLLCDPESKTPALDSFFLNDEDLYENPIPMMTDYFQRQLDMKIINLGMLKNVVIVINSNNR